VQKEMWDLSGEMGEDCLTLNVWTPGVDGARRPVMVWIHGGSFVVGAARRAVTDGASLARNGDVVVVTLNYRLGALGWLHLDEFGGELDRSGNHGLLDQIAALEWVRDNIDRFGGDPENVTLFGESAGGISVSVLLTAPAARGLFHRAVAQSGAGNIVRSVDQAREVAHRFVRHAGVDDLAGLQRLSEEEILGAQEAAMNEGNPDLAFGPVFGDPVVPRLPMEAIAEGDALDVPARRGTTLDEYRYWYLENVGLDTLRPEHLATRVQEMTERDPSAVFDAYRKGRPGLTEGEVAIAVIGDLAFRMPTIRLAEAWRRAGRDAWLYLVSWSSPVQGGKLGAPHAVEIPFVFGNLTVPNVPRLIGDGPGHGSLVAAMQGAWVAFARTGNPSHERLLGWPRYDTERRPTMLFDTPSRLVEDPYPDERQAWGDLPFDGIRPRVG
jgi:para-nitrobenzyl esterase